MIRSKRYKYIKRLYETDEFYDLEKVPYELHNLMNEPEYKEEILKMKDDMLEWYQGTCDVVPFKPDNRFSSEMIWSKFKNICPKDKLDEFKELINSGADFNRVNNWFNQQVKNKDC